MPPLKIIEALLQQAIAEGSRSTALKPLGWLLAMLLPAILLSVQEESAVWLTVFLSLVSVVVFSVYLGAFLYLIVHDRDALRSDTYSLRKMAIQKGTTNDNLTALLDTDDRQRASSQISE